MKLPKILLALMLASTSSFAQNVQGQEGNGGGLVKKNGRYMTFYSAGFYVEPVEKTQDEVPELDNLIRFFSTHGYIPKMRAVNYISALVPRQSRQYFKVKEDSFTPEVRARLLAEYARVMKVDAADVAIAAVTDTQAGITYLFPEFYTLNDVEQKTILFHEAYWILYPNAIYPEVTHAEMVFQAHLEKPDSPERIIELLKIVANKSASAGLSAEVFSGAIKIDLEKGYLNGLTEELTYRDKREIKSRLRDSELRQLAKNMQKLSILALFGEDFIECTSLKGEKACWGFFIRHLYELKARFPDSLFLRVIDPERMEINSSYGYNFNEEQFIILPLPNFTESTYVQVFRGGMTIAFEKGNYN